MALFSQDFQAGGHFEVFSAQGSQPLLNWKTTANNVKKVYDKSVKGYIFSCNNGRMQLPKDERKSMMLHQPVLVLQMMLIPERAFSLEVGFTDTGNTRRRLILSSSFSDVKVTPLHCQLPIQQLPRGLWLNVALDLSTLVPHLFPGQSSKTISQLILGPFCRLRRIFTLRELQTIEGEFMNIPKAIDFLPSIRHVSHVFKISDTNSTSHLSKFCSDHDSAHSNHNNNSNHSNNNTNGNTNINTTTNHSSSMPALPAAHTTGDFAHSASDPSDGSGQDVRSETTTTPRNKVNLKDLPHLAFGSRYTTPTPSTSGRRGGSGRDGSASRSRSRRSHMRDTNLSIQGEREICHTRSTSSEHVGKSTNTLMKQASNGRENLLASIGSLSSSMKSSSSMNAESMENVKTDHLPFTRKKKNFSDKRVLGLIGGEKDMEPQTPGSIHATQKHPRMLSRSARAVMSSDDKLISNKKVSSSDNNNSSSPSASLNGNFLANNSRYNRENSMGASAPSNMMGSLPRNRRSLEHQLLRQARKNMRPGSEQGKVAINNSKTKQSVRTFPRGKYDRTRYSDSDAQSITTTPTTKYNINDGENNVNNSNKNSDNTIMKNEVSGGKEIPVIQELSSKIKTSNLDYPLPKQERTSDECGGTMAERDNNNGNNNNDNSTITAQNSINVLQDSKFEFHSSPRALSSSRTLEPLKLNKNSSLQKDVDKSQEDPTGESSKANGEVLQWARKMNTIYARPSQKVEDTNSNNDADRSSATTATIALSKIDSETRHNDKLSVARKFDSTETGGASIQSVSYDSMDVVHKDSTTIKNDNPQVSEGEKPIETDEKTVSCDRNGGDHNSNHIPFEDAFFGSVADSIDCDISYDYDVNERLAHGAFDFNTNFNAAHLNRAFTPPVIFKKDIVVASNESVDHFPKKEKSKETESENNGDLDLMYDPILNCYYDPKTNLYYELKQ